jgi:UrcA family protein
MYRPLIAATLALSTIAAPALAATDAFKMEVEFSRDRLATPQGASAEYQKIRDQIVERCETEHAAMTFGKAFAVNACSSRTLSSAVRQIANPVLTSVHLEAKG